MIAGGRELEYEERLEQLGLESLNYTRDTGDMIETYKFTQNLYESSTPFKYSETNSRGQILRIMRNHFRAQFRQTFFRHRATNFWYSNALLLPILLILRGSGGSSMLAV